MFEGLIYLNPIKFRAPLCLWAIYFCDFNFRAVKQFIYLRTNNFCALTRLYVGLSYMTENVQQDTAWNMSKYGLSLFRIFPYMDRIVSVFSRIWTEIQENTDTILPTYGKIRIRESPYFAIFHALREQELDAN